MISLLFRLLKKIFKLYPLNSFVIFQNWWERGVKRINCPKLSKNINSEFLVIGGGIAGLHAALYLVNHGKKVILLEKTSCPGSSSAKSSGFLTPASELNFSQMVDKYGLKNAKIIWDIPLGGIKEILNNVKKYKIECDLESQDCLYLSINKSGEREVKEEKDAHDKIGMPNKYYDSKTIGKVISSNAYSTGLRTYDTHSINSLKYCIGLKSVLLKKGVKIFENSEVLKIEGNLAYTKSGSVNAKKIIVCADKMKKRFSKLSKKIYHMQTFLAISEKMSKEQIRSIFPKEKMMCWDSKLGYNYFRITKDNRILFGSTYAVFVYSLWEVKFQPLIKLNIRKFEKSFPKLKNVKFVSYWAGLIDISKDMMPIADFDEDNKNIFYVLGNAGLPWATHLGIYAAKKLLNENVKNTKDYEKFFKAKRKFFISDFVQRLITKILSFLISNLHTEYS